MDFRRKLTALTSIALLVATGWIASTHTHVHSSGDGGTGQVHAGSCSHPHSDCSHPHPNSDANPQDTNPSHGDHEHNDCQICKLLASFHSTATIGVQHEITTVITGKFCMAAPVVVAPIARPTSARGPPV